MTRLSPDDFGVGGDWTGRRKGALIAALLILLPASSLPDLLGVKGGPVARAQSSVPSRHQARPAPSRDRPASGVTDLPSWARPQGSSEGATGRPGTREKRKSGEGPGSVRSRNGPPLPPAGNRNVPLGGLEWLLLAGGGYAVWKLRRDGETDGALFGGL